MSSASNSRADGGSVWDDLLATHGHSGDGHRHESRHSRLEHVADLTTSVAGAYLVGTILDTALDVPGSGLNLLGTALPGGGEEAAGATAGLASGLLGSLFSA